MSGWQIERGKEGGFANPALITYIYIYFFLVIQTKCMCHDCFLERRMICYLRRFIFVTKGVVYENFSNQSYCQYSNPAPIFTNKLIFNTGFLSEKVHPISFLGLMGAKATILYPVKK